MAKLQPVQEHNLIEFSPLWMLLDDSTRKQWTFMPKLFALIATCLFYNSCFSGELLRDATVTEVANTNGGAEFAVKFLGGYGSCAGEPYLIFPESKAKSQAAHRQAIATALLAFASGKKVRIHNFEDNSCSGANFISISN